MKKMGTVTAWVTGMCIGAAIGNYMDMKKIRTMGKKLRKMF